MYFLFQAPPPGTVPPGSTVLEMACESPFSDAELNGLHYQVSISSVLYIVFSMFLLST
jgi:hypothetical protein